jgi:RecB family exonuclease
MALRCPREFHYRYVDKIKEAEQSPEARIGKAVHAVLERAVLGTPLAEATAAARREMKNEAERVRLADLEQGIAHFLDRLAQFRRRRSVGRQMVEFNVAVREDLSITQFHASDAFYRGVFDLGYLYDEGKLAVVDHKCGERRVSPSFTDQLEGYAVLAGSLFRNVRHYWLGVYWVAEQTLDWARVSAQQVREELTPRVIANIEAAALAVDDGPRPAPSDWCLFCSYRSICPAAHDLLLEPVDDEDPDWDL